MTHSDIYTKFMIEYDKANITSSYPSLTKYEIATILDKAYLALIAQKYTGNNPRGVAFEKDIKAVADLQPIVNNASIVGPICGDNSYEFSTDGLNALYFVDGEIKVNKTITSYDGQGHTMEQVVFMSHADARNFKATSSNMPWVERPVAVFESNKIITYVDPTVVQANGDKTEAKFIYIKQPAKFVTGPGVDVLDYDFSSTPFELSDSMAEELINLAIIMSTEIVESSRLSTKGNLRSLES